MKINGVLEGGLLEDSASCANPNKIGAITTGQKIVSDIHAPIGNVRPVYVGDGASSERIALASEVIQADSKIASDIAQTNLRVSFIESSLSSGANRTTLQSIPSPYSFTSCSIGTHSGYTFLRLLSSSSTTSSISKDIALGYILSTISNAYGLTSSEFRLIADNSLEFSTPPLAWSYDLTQSQTHAAPYTVIDSFSALILSSYSCSLRDLIASFSLSTDSILAVVIASLDSFPKSAVFCNNRRLVAVYFSVA